MKTLLLSVAPLMFCPILLLSQNCDLEISQDTFVCGYSYTLTANIPGGEWHAICDTTTSGLADFFEINDTATSVTVDQCGSYSFRYVYLDADSLLVFDSIQLEPELLIDTLTLLDTICLAADTIHLAFENPSQVDFDFVVNVTVGYPESACPQNDTINCRNNFESGEDGPPDPVWTFQAAGICNTTIIEAQAEGSTDCETDQIQFQSNSYTGAIADTFSYLQSDFLQTDPLTGQILVNDYQLVLNEVITQTIANGTDQCPTPTFCGNSPPWCIDTLRDTTTMVIPVQANGEWLLYPEEGADPIPLMDTTLFIKEDSTYLITAAPSPHSYNTNFSLYQIDYLGDTIVATQPGTLSFQWTQEWVNDTIEQVNIILQDTCCSGGFNINREVIDPPAPPEYSCEPFSVVFVPILDASYSVVACDSASYRIEMYIEGGRPPYHIEGVEGAFVEDSIFLSGPIPIAERLNVQVLDIDSCGTIMFLSPCPCIALEVESPQDFVLNCAEDCQEVNVSGTNSLGGTILYSWYDADDNLLQTGATVDFCETGAYYLVSEEVLSGCSVVDSFEIIEEYPVADVTTEELLNCDHPEIGLAGDSISVGPSYTYFWAGPGIAETDEMITNPVISDPGTYYLTVTDTINNCTDTTSVVIDADFTTPLAEAGESINLNCRGEGERIGEIVNEDRSDLFYRWLMPDGQVFETSTSPFIFGNQEGVYQLTVRNTVSGCESIDSVRVLPFEEISFSTSTRPSCWNRPAGEVIIDSVSGGDPPYAYSADGLIFSPFPFLEGLNQGSYMITIRDSEGCESTGFVSIDEIGPIDVSLEDQFYLCGEGAIELDVSTTVENGMPEYTWWNGNEEPFEVINGPGLYSVTIKTECETQREEFTVTDLLAVNENFSVPNIFTPNGDGNNDVFRVFTSLLLVDFELKVYNRWGSQVFSSTDPLESWNGTVNGKPAPSDVYAWIVKTRMDLCDGGEDFLIQKGEVTLMR